MYVCTANHALCRWTTSQLQGWLKEMAARTGQREPKAGAVDLLEKLLALDPSKRLLAMDAFRVSAGGCLGVSVS
jgi:hypothetical protein